MKQAQIQRRRSDRTEREERRGAEHHQCYKCAMAGKRGVRATVGELCEKHFAAVKFVRKW